MRMIFADDIAHETSRFFVRLIPGIAHVVHGVKHAAVDRFESVTHVGQSAADDDAHGVVHEGLAHLVFDIDGNLLLFQRRFHLSLSVPVVQIVQAVKIVLNLLNELNVLNFSVS